MLFRSADDMILLIEHDITKAVNMNLLLLYFEHLSGLKINSHKHKIFCFGKANEEENRYAIFYCESGSLPFKYLGVPILYRKHLTS